MNIVASRSDSTAQLVSGRLRHQRDLTAGSSGGGDGGLVRIELEQPLVVAACQRRTVGMVVSEVDVVVVRSVGGVAAVLADVHLVAALLVAERQLESVYLAAVGLERTALRERLLAMFTLVRSYTCVTDFIFIYTFLM